MATDRQITANRLNALKSTGPRTPEGKARAALNRLNTGIHAQSLILPNENPEALQELADRYFADFQPATEDERFLVDSLVRCEWRSRRFARVEVQVWAEGMDGPLRRQEPNAAGTGFGNRSNTLDRLDRIIDRNQRAYLRARRELDLLQAARHAAEAATPDKAPELESAPPPAQTTEPVAPTPELGSNLQIVSPAASTSKLGPETAPNPVATQPGITQRNTDAPSKLA